jgi:hypothetical protein
MVLDQAAPLVYAAAQITVALILALPAVFIRALRRPAKLALVTALAVLVLVFALVLTFDLASPTGRPPLGTTLFIGIVGGVIWGTVFFVLAYVPLALLALFRARRR